MATPNYGYEKRQRELAKKRKAEEKKQKKLQGGSPSDHEGPEEAAAETPVADAPPAPAAG